jgi:hypothetical protein
MCLIVDANLASLVFGEPAHSDFQPIIVWLTSPRENGRLVFGGRLANELNKVNAARRFVRALQQAGRARFIPMVVIEAESNSLRAVCVSNDPHVIALARVSGARILCSRDKALHQDFSNTKLVSRPRGHVYQNAKHKHLLRSYGHTWACKQTLRIK